MAYNKPNEESMDFDGLDIRCKSISLDGEGVKATAAQLNMAAVPAASVEVVTAANVITAEESGKTFFLNAAAGFASTLPAPAAGLRFKFVVKAAPTSGDYTIVTTGGADIICGGVNELEVDTGDDGPYLADADTVAFKSGVAVAGDWVEVISDGTLWFLTGQTNADGAITLSKT